MGVTIGIGWHGDTSGGILLFLPSSSSSQLPSHPHYRVVVVVGLLSFSGLFIFMG